MRPYGLRVPQTHTNISSPMRVSFEPTIPGIVPYPDRVRAGDTVFLRVMDRDLLAKTQVVQFKVQRVSCYEIKMCVQLVGHVANSDAIVDTLPVTLQLQMETKVSPQPVATANNTSPTTTTSSAQPPSYQLAVDENSLTGTIAGQLIDVRTACGLDGSAPIVYTLFGGDNRQFTVIDSGANAAVTVSCATSAACLDRESKSVYDYVMIGQTAGESSGTRVQKTCLRRSTFGTDRIAHQTKRQERQSATCDYQSAGSQHNHGQNAANADRVCE